MQKQLMAFTLHSSIHKNKNAVKVTNIQQIIEE